MTVPGLFLPNTIVSAVVAAVVVAMNAVAAVQAVPAHSLRAPGAVKQLVLRQKCLPNRPYMVDRGLRPRS